MVIKNKTIVLEESLTWPSILLNFLNDNIEVLPKALSGDYVFSNTIYEKIEPELQKIVKPFCLKGYHCTRLTDFEISNIISDGMSLQNGKSLKKRIEKLHNMELINSDIVEKLASQNQADDNNRANKLWFCFFEPKKQPKACIERFFKSWGGEALYNSHEDNKETGHVLRKIGVPCIIEADVPILNLCKHSFLTDKLIINFLKNQKYKIKGCPLFESYSEKDILSSNIKNIFLFPSPKFIELSGYNNWNETL